MIMKSLHQREKPITPRMTDTMPLISKDIAKPPDIPGIPGDAPGNPSLGKNSPESNTDPPAAAQFLRETPIMEWAAWQGESLPQ
jgi:hypothetical protein